MDQWQQGFANVFLTFIQCIKDKEGLRKQLEALYKSITQIFQFWRAICCTIAVVQQLNFLRDRRAQCMRPGYELLDEATENRNWLFLVLILMVEVNVSSANT